MEAKRIDLVRAIEQHMKQAIDLFYREITLAFAPLAAFCTAERRRYEPLVQRADTLKETFAALATRLRSGEE